MNRDLYLKILPAATIIRDFVSNESQCNYEYYLVELLNASKYFTGLHKEAFIWSDTQSNGECDAYSGKYGIDFKMIAARSELHAKSVFSPQAYRCQNGIVAYGPSQKSGTRQVTRLHAALCGKTLEDFETIRQQNLKGENIDSDIQYYLKSLEKKKNLMLFFPYRLYFQGSSDYPDGVRIAVEAIEKDFLPSMKYRETVVHGYDTYFATVYYDSFLILRYINNRFSFVELVPTAESKIFTHLENDYSSIFGG